MPDELSLDLPEYDDFGLTEDEDECETCNGSGWIAEAELESDWVNYSSERVVPCPDCDKG